MIKILDCAIIVGQISPKRVKWNTEINMKGYSIRKYSLLKILS